VLEGAGHDPVAHPGEDAGHVLHRLAAVEADFFVTQDQPLAAELGHGDGEAHARAQAGLLEDHREGFAGEEGVVAAGLLELLLQALADIQEMVKTGAITSGMLPKVEACITALQAGVGKAHIIDGRIPHSLLLEIYTEAGIGTEIVL
jgi:hypothetical protein